MSHNSGVWKFFTVSVTDSSRAHCTLCNTSYSRGKERGSMSSLNTSNLHDHLMRKHPIEYKSLISAENNCLTVKH